ncbi:uncharacterized protein LOC142180778 [Nicotiana tabacum]|uniref:Uncharacterized protein LOC142180778 n=1 Tax=Nicotiana tabacum TaxID=4097 RepID=A0AC58UHH9_TOBAC
MGPKGDKGNKVACRLRIGSWNIGTLAAFELVIVDSMFLKREEHLVTFWSMVAKTQIDYLLLRRCDRGCARIASDGHQYLDEEEEEVCTGSVGVRWGALSKDNVQELEGRLTNMGAWKSGRDARAMWMATMDCIREAAREVLGILKGYSGEHRDDWWWNDVVQGKVEFKKAAYTKLVESTNED